MNDGTALQRPTVFSGHRGPVYSIIAAEHAGTFFSAGADGHVVRWDLRAPDSGELIADLGTGVYSMLLDAARRLLFVGDSTGGLHVLDLAAREEKRVVRAHTKGIYAMAELPSGRIACAGGDGRITIWNARELTDAAPIRQLPLCEEKVRAIALMPGGKRMAVACGDGNVRILDARDFNEHHTLIAHPGGANSLAWHPTKAVLLSGGKDGKLCFWHSGEEFRKINELQAHAGSTYAIAFSPSGEVCATAARDKFVKLWRASDFAPIARASRAGGGHTHSVNALWWADEHTLVSGGDDRQVLVWKIGG